MLWWSPTPPSPSMIAWQLLSFPRLHREFLTLPVPSSGLPRGGLCFMTDWLHCAQVPVLCEQPLGL